MRLTVTAALAYGVETEHAQRSGEALGRVGGAHAALLGGRSRCEVALAREQRLRLPGVEEGLDAASLEQRAPALVATDASRSLCRADEPRVPTDQRRAREQEGKAGEQPESDARAERVAEQVRAGEPLAHDQRRHAIDFVLEGLGAPVPSRRQPLRARVGARPPVPEPDKPLEPQAAAPAATADATAGTAANQGALAESLQRPIDRAEAA